MADNSPNYRVEQQRLNMQILEQQAAMARSKLEVMEIIDRIDRNLINITATNNSFAIHRQEEVQATTIIEKQRKKSQIAALTANLERQTLENLELSERAMQMYRRYEAEDKAASVFSAQLHALDLAHGALADESIGDMVRRVHPLAEEGPPL